jgi:predicted alpha-1,2-mannosidase
MNRKFHFSLALCLLLFPVISSGQLTQYVNPFIGTGGHGHTYPGASMPFGMMQLSPDTRLEGWDGCSAYHYSDDTIYGFSHTHLSGTGCSDYGDILIMPANGSVQLNSYAYRSHFDHASEIAKPGYYKVFLKDPSVAAEMTVTSRAGIHRYTFSNPANPSLVIDLKHRDEVLESSIKLVNDTTIVGYRRSRAWAEDQRVYFALILSQPVDKMLISIGEKTAVALKSASGKNLRTLLLFKPLASSVLSVKIGISAVSTDNALLNLTREIGGKTFDQIAAEAESAWEKELSKISIEAISDTTKINFYTALYHAFLQPNLYSDVNGQYRGRDMKVHNSGGFDYYTVFSLWDTYRATHPLYTLVQQKRSSDFINTFIRQYEEGKLLPVWELSSSETNCMIGYHAVPVIVDAYVKGITGFDANKALEAMKASASQDHFGLDAYKKQGYIASADAAESVSRTLEYAYDDWCIAQMAQLTGKYSDYQTYIRRAQSYKNLFDPETGFMRARHNGSFVKPFDPAEVNFNYTEANSWQYSFYVPQDLAGWVQMLGGQQNLVAFLDRLFSAKSETTGRDQADITGLIGQYAHGNEPSHHMAYLYDYAGEPWKTQEIVHRLQKEMYRNQPDGLCGNEDCGQMSSWLVMSSLGFYPVTPGSEEYMFGTPAFKKASLQLENGKTFVIVAENISDQNYYIQSASLNGQPLNKPYIKHSEIMNGGTLTFVMGPQPNKNFAIMQSEDFPSAIKDALITPAPYLSGGDYVFNDSTILIMNDCSEKARIYYTTDGSQPTENSALYKNPLHINKTSTLKMMAVQEACSPSAIVTATFKKIDGSRSLSVVNPWSPQYSAGGERALIDYIYGSADFRTGSWQGYEGSDLNATLDLGSIQPVSSVSIRFLQDNKSWIFMPLQIEFFVSDDNKSFKSLGTLTPATTADKPGSVIETFTKKFKTVNARYVRVIAKNRGTCPDWHPGAGKKSWIFTDEITVE